MNNRPIGVFDSGVGGLTVVRSLTGRLPGENIIYLGDDARGPYGPRDLGEVRGFAREIIEYLLGLEVKLVVIACNTATAAALDDAQRDYNIPVVGVIRPGARAALQRSTSRRIGVVGTVGTIQSGSYERELKRLDPTVEVHSQACPEFVEFVERSEIHGKRIGKIARGYLEPMVEAGVDTIILGCTHYPLLEDLIEEVVGPGVALISSADETAVDVEGILERLGWSSDGGSPGRMSFLTTGNTEKCIELGRTFLGPEVNGVTPVDLNTTPELDLVRED
ncbi:MAG: glutamate racemase [Actinobacteria bacterium]|nr:glutamate racemase [Actinomycetota bacterium]MBU4301712.1 glutamate racemase [Actinomycetota bacterium]